MNRQTIPTSSPSSTSCAARPASVALPPARAIAVLLTVFLLALPVAACAAGGALRVPRTLLALGVALAGRSALRRDYRRQGPRAVRALAWDASGRFTVELGSGEAVSVNLSHGSLAVGPFLWLVLQGRRRHPVFIDRRHLEPEAAAALLRILRQAGRRPMDLR